MITKLATSMMLISSILPGMSVSTPDENATVFVAHHAAKHTRFGDTKAAEPYTGEIATRSGNHSIVQQEPIYFSSDSIDKRTDPVATQIHRAVKNHKTIVDIHGMDNSHGADVIIGTGKTMTDTEKEIVDKIVSGFQSYGIFVKVNTGEFNATTPWTVSGYAESKDKNNSVIQVELSENIRTHRLDECVSVLS